MKDTKQHSCAARGCTQQVPDYLLMCSRHWFQVPKATRDRVFKTYALWRRGIEGAKERHRAACRDAIAAVGELVEKK